MRDDGIEWPTQGPKAVKPVTIGVDHGAGDDMTVEVAAHREADGTLVLDSINERSPPKRDRAAYMRTYRARKRAERALEPQKDQD